MRPQPITQALREAAAAITAAKSIVVAGHVNPDGDSLGCTLALTHALRAIGKDVTPLSADGVPEIYRWMPGADLLQSSSDRCADLGILCDAGTPERVGSAGPAIAAARASLVIDHHASAWPYGNTRVIDPRAAATGEIVYRLLRLMRTPFTREIADSLLCAIVTDTGSFRFMNVTGATFRVSAALMRYGACPARISELVFESRSFASVKLLGRALERMRITDDGQVAWSTLSAADFAEYAASDEDTEGIVTHIRAVRGAEVGALLRETPQGVRVSLRSRKRIDVSRVAEQFDGGGHQSAAGCTIQSLLAEAVAAVLGALGYSV